jgi:hypothetical protein
MYIGASAAAGQSSEAVQKSGGSSNTVIWHRGAMSKRFDGKDETVSKPTTIVRRNILFVKAVTHASLDSRNQVFYN